MDVDCKFYRSIHKQDVVGGAVSKVKKRWSSMMWSNSPMRHLTGRLVARRGAASTERPLCQWVSTPPPLRPSSGRTESKFCQSLVSHYPGLRDFQHGRKCRSHVLPASAIFTRKSSAFGDFQIICAWQLRNSLYLAHYFIMFSCLPN